MRSSPSQQVAVLALAGVLIAQVVIAGSPARAAATPTDRLPDLAMGRPADLRLVSAAGKRKLRFTTFILNLGAGPFETRAYRKSLRAKDDAGPPADLRRRRRAPHDPRRRRSPSTRATGTITGTSSGSPATSSTPTPARDRRSAAVPRSASASSIPGSTGSSCRAHPRRGATSNGAAARRRPHSIKIGLSVGWADVYPWNFAWQWVNVTGLPAGRTCSSSVADPDLALPRDARGE